MTTPAQEYDELLKRLYVSEEGWYEEHAPGTPEEFRNSVMRDAAAAITALRAERDAAVEALAPFAEFVFAPLIDDSETFILQQGRAVGEYADLVPTITAGDLRRAASLASRKPAP